MGTEIVIPIVLLVWLLSIAFILYRMLINKRQVAFWSVLIGSLLSIIPPYLALGSNLFLIIELEFIAAIGIGLVALIYSKRWQVASLYSILFLFYLSENKGNYLLSKFTGIDLFGLLPEIGILSAPIFIALTLVFCVGAFWENRTLQTQNN